MKLKIKKIYAGILTMVFVSIVSVSCDMIKPSKAVITFFSGTATLKTIGIPVRPLQVQMALKDGDIIETGDSSLVVVQFGDEIVVRFESNTKVTITSIENIIKREINLESGKVLSNVSKLKKGSEYSVKTPVAIASVRGTEFLTEAAENRTTVAVGKGAVNVERTDTKEEVLVEIGSSIDVSEKSVKRPISAVEILELKKLESVPFVSDSEKLDREDLGANFKNTVKTDEEINKEINEEILKEINEQINREIALKKKKTKKRYTMSFREMKARFNRIDVVTLYNGQIIKGIIISRAPKLKVMTPRGLVSVLPKRVKGTGVL